MKLSIIELGTVEPGTTEADALADAVKTAEHADLLGFHRVWFAEHHMSRSNASHHPEVLIAYAGARTHGIRVGSGSVLLNNYSPFKVAEMFQELDALIPGRVDLGLGRATSGQIIDAALRQDRGSRPVDDHPERVAEVLAWLYEAFPDEHPFAGEPLMPSRTSVPETWLLGSSPNGYALAAQLGIGYSFAGFINPLAAAGALRSYRNEFRPAGFGLERPNAMLAVNVSVGADEEDAQRLVASAKGFYARLARQGTSATLPTADEALAELPRELLEEPTSIVEGAWPRFVAGTPEQVRSTFDIMIEQSGADELMIQNLIADPEDRRASHTRLAEMYEL
jgi:luciferase family oxidoreductase group 1